MKVIIDNGHGINTAGKRSPQWPDGTQLLEYEFNRDIAKRLSKALDNLSIKNVIIVPEETDISLTERVERANHYYMNNPDSFLLSIHANAGGGTGWEVFTSKGQTRSDKIAEFFVEAAKNRLSAFPIRRDMRDGDSDKEEDFYILRYTNCPAVLTENLFMDTEKDCRMLMSNAGRDTITGLHVDAILKIKGLWNSLA